MDPPSGRLGQHCQAGLSQSEGRRWRHAGRQRVHCGWGDPISASSCYCGYVQVRLGRVMFLECRSVVRVKC